MTRRRFYARMVMALSDFSKSKFILGTRGVTKNEFSITATRAEVKQFLTRPPERFLQKIKKHILNGEKTKKKF